MKSKKTTAADIGESPRDGADDSAADYSAAELPSAAPPGPRKSTVAKVSHTLSIALAERLEEFAFFQRVSESAVIEFALNSFFSQKGEDAELGDILRRDGAGRRRKS